MNADGYITLTREITAIKIPEGADRVLPAGTTVAITQELGGTFTVMAPDFGGLFGSKTATRMRSGVKRSSTSLRTASLKSSACGSNSGRCMIRRSP